VVSTAMGGLGFVGAELQQSSQMSAHAELHLVLKKF